jgi:hypothetical protein
MKLFVFLLVLLNSISLWANEKHVCTVTKALHDDNKILAVKSKLEFYLDKDGDKSVISNFHGHLLVKVPLSDNDQIEGRFEIAEIEASPKYRPTKFKGHAAFKEVTAYETTGVEKGMTGYFSVDVTPKKENILAIYVFKAGEHLGGSIYYNCSSSPRKQPK